MLPREQVQPDDADSLTPSDRSFLQHVANGEYVPSSSFSNNNSHSSGIVGYAARLGFTSDGFSRTGCYSLNPDEFEYIPRPPYGDPEDWHNGEYIGVQRYLPNFVPATLPDVAIYNTLWPSTPILHLGKTVPVLDSCTFDELCSNDLDQHYCDAEMEYHEEFIGRCPREYYIEWFQSHNNVDHMDDEDSYALKEPEAKRPKVMPGCN